MEVLLPIVGVVIVGMIMALRDASYKNLKDRTIVKSTSAFKEFEAKADAARERNRERGLV